MTIPLYKSIWILYNIKKLLKKDYPLYQQKITFLCQEENNVFDVYGKFGFFLGQTGHPDHAEKILNKALSYKQAINNNKYIASYMQLLPNYTDPKKYPIHVVQKKLKHMGYRYAGHAQQRNFNEDTNLNRKLRVGFTCHFFDDPTSQLLLIPIFEHMDHTKIELFIYSDQDPILTSERSKNSGDHWIDSYHYTDEQLSTHILKDKIDIFVECNGWTEKNRFKILNKRVAPLQGTMYNISAPSGIEGVDFHIGEYEYAQSVDPLRNRLYMERHIALPHNSIPYVFTSQYPTIAPPPSIKNGFITFGSFGAVHKVTKTMIHHWSTILNTVPKSKFLMKARELDDLEILAIYKSYFSEYTDLKNIIFEGGSSLEDLLNTYAKIDIALDTNPHYGGTTTINALFMGVPVVSVDFGRPISINYPLLDAGHPELIGKNVEEFINIAVNLANDPHQLNQYRNTLRDDLNASPAANIQEFSNTITNTFINLWQEYKDGEF